jgi:hypothetical protein
VKRRLLFVLVLLSGAVLAAAVVLSRGFLSTGEGDRAATPGPFDSDLEAESRELDRQ